MGNRSERNAEASAAALTLARSFRCLPNHVKQALVGLYGLQADEHAIKRYWRFYTECTPYGYPLSARQNAGEPLGPNEWRELLGQKQKYEELLLFFDNEEHLHGLDETIRKFAPTLVQGMPGAMTHGIIHLGWGLDVRNRRMILEGLAYMVHSGLSTHPERFVHRAENERTPFESFLRIADAERREGVRAQVFEAAVNHEKYSEASNFRTDLIPSGFQWQVAKVLEEGHPILYHLPTWIDDLEFEDALEMLYKDVAILYLTTTGEHDEDEDEERLGGCFLGIHFLISLWGAEQVAVLLPVEEQRAVLKAYYVTVLSLLLTSSNGIPTAEALLGVQERCNTADDPDDFLVSADWNSVLPRAISENEAHNIKLAYVASKLWHRYAYWKGFRIVASSFTITPRLGPGRAAFFFMDMLRHFTPPFET
mmetsp:Transcript_16661/g.63360  ORF Transcript_16661/g.63360 Transcript_16661/m.63360 type:complete len:423 (-) Transcript_16661:337-1605(-)